MEVLSGLFSILVLVVIVSFLEHLFDTAKHGKLDIKPDTEPFITKASLMSRADKRKYLQSAKWKALKAQALERDNHQCVECGSPYTLDLHHITYVRLGNEHLSDVAILCRECHSQKHKRLGYSRLTTYPVKRR
jgi:ribosomal protein L37AE/L43A